ncbi:MAG: MASE3 domain-containing protein [Candidatus Electrothrix sp. YB6]
MKIVPESVGTHFSLSCLAVPAAAWGLYWAGSESYLLFHTLAGVFSSIIACAIFIFAWNTRQLQANHYFLFLGIAYLFVGAIDFGHTLAYREMQIFPELPEEFAVHLRLAARYTEGISLLLAFFFLRKKINEYIVFLVYLAFVSLLFRAIFSQPSFPAFLMERVGPVVCRKDGEYLICCMLLCTLFLLHKQRRFFDRTVLRFLQAGIICTIIAELAFAGIAGLFSPSGMIGHFCKIFSFYCIYRAILEIGLSRPYNILFREIKKQGADLEDKVRERTAALQQSTEYLEKEITERIKAEKELRWELAVNRELAAVSDTLISRSFTFQEVAGPVLRSAYNLTDCLYAMLISIDRGSGTVTAYPLSFSEQNSAARHEPLLLFSGSEGEYPGLWGQSLNTQQGFCMDFVRSVEQQDTGFPCDFLPKKNYLNVPVVIDREAVGLIALADKRENFTRYNLLAVERLAALLALFIQRREMEKALTRSEFKYRSLFNDAPDMIHIIDDEQRIISVNPVELRTLGYGKEEIVGSPLLTLIHPDWQKSTAQTLEQIFAAGECVKNYETVLLSKSGEQIDVEVSAVPQLEQGRVVSVRAIMRNITERKKEEKEKRNLELQLRQARKMEAIGTLAGGIAHDFNNILGPIFGYTELALDILPAEDRASLWLREVLRASHRARELVRQILTISRKTDQEVQPLRIQFIIKEALKLLRSSLPSSIEIRQNIDPDCAAVMADPTRIHQVIMNLCTNAYHAMRETGGVLDVTLQPVEFELYEDNQNHNRNSRMRLQPGRYLQLCVSDTGCGIPMELLEKIFEPYFTTRGQGEGTGLGLALVQSIILDLGGDITVCSEPGKGTVFDICLPVCTAGRKPAQITEDSSRFPQGNERILVVDDDRELGRMSKNVLESLGYQVIVYTDSSSALAAFQQEPDFFDLILTDMTMPRMTGDKLSGKILALRPDMPIIICTGFSELMDERKARDIGARAFIMKPFTKKELACSVRQVLDCQVLDQASAEVIC